MACTLTSASAGSFGRSLGVYPFPRLCGGAPVLAQEVRRVGTGVQTHRTHQGRRRIAMISLLPPAQLTTSELAREIAALEVLMPDLPGDSGDQTGGRLTALYRERDERSRLAERNLRAAGAHFPDDAS